MKIALSITLLVLLGSAQARVTASKDLALLKQGCSDPASVGNQNAPSEINVTCSSEVLTWQMSVANPMDLAQSATVTSSATTDKTNVNAEESSATAALPSVAAGCPTWTKANATASTTVMVTCAQVMEMEDLNAFCAQTLSQNAAANPNLWTATKAGEVYEPCTMTEPTPEPPGDPVQIYQPIYIPDDALIPVQLPALR